jgi:hypothetical protein
MKNYYVLSNPERIGLMHRIMSAVAHESQLDVIRNVEGVDHVHLPIGTLTMVDIWTSPLYDADDVWLRIVAALDAHVVIVQAEIALTGVSME